MAADRTGEREPKARRPYVECHGCGQEFALPAGDYRDEEFKATCPRRACPNRESFYKRSEVRRR
jgi:hypothetical protein